MKKKLYLFMALSLQGLDFAQAPIINYTSTSQTYATGTAITPLSPTNTGGTITYGKVTTFAGSGGYTFTDGASMVASFYRPSGVAVDASGNVFVVDRGYDRIRKITQGVVTTFAGGGNIGTATDGTGTAASFYNPTGVATDASGNVYVADYSNNKIRKITAAGVVTTLAGSGNLGSADGTGTAAGFDNPTGVAVDASGNIYVADNGNNKIRKITSAGVVSSYAGPFLNVYDNGFPASFNYPQGVAVDASGNLYVSDPGNNNKIRKITPAGVVINLAGSGTVGAVDGIGPAASFNLPMGIAVDAMGNVYVADGHNNKIRKITSAGVVTTLAGGGNAGYADGIGTAASFNFPQGVAVDTSGYVYIADASNDRIRKIDAVGGYSVAPQLPAGLSIDASTGIISGTPTVVSPKTSYTVTATNRDGTTTATVEITVNSNLGVEDIAFKNMEVYPNPTTGEVNINNVMLEKVNVYNNAGQLVKTVANPEASNATTLQLSNLPTGAYYLNIETENASTVRQVIKK